MSRVTFNHRQLFLSGCNLAWFDFARDVGTGTPDTSAYADLFSTLHAAGGNCVRWWIHVDGRTTPSFDGTGRVSGPGEHTIQDLQKILDIAWRNGIGLDLCLWSFDMLRTSNTPAILNRNMLLLTDTAATGAYLSNCLVPVLDALGTHPAVLCWEIFNEPEGMSDEFGWSGIAHVPMSAIQRFINRCSGTIHRHSPGALVTSGAWCFTSLTDVQVAAGPAKIADADTLELSRYLSSRYRFAISGAEILGRLRQLGSTASLNYYADARLKAAGGDPDGVLDFFSVHYYDWAGTALSPLHHPATTWGLSRPVVAAEFALKSTFGVGTDRIYETLYQQGYAGALAWAWTDTSFSRRADIISSLRAMREAHGSDVDVFGEGTDTLSPGAMPTNLELLQNFPNPFNGLTEIRFRTPEPAMVRLQVVDLLGREVAVLVDEQKAPGNYHVIFNAGGLASGVYVYRLTAGAVALTRSMVLTK